jgi:type IV secretory pathway TrbL component
LEHNTDSISEVDYKKIDWENVSHRDKQSFEDNVIEYQLIRTILAKASAAQTVSMVIFVLCMIISLIMIFFGCSLKTTLIATLGCQIVIAVLSEANYRIARTDFLKNYEQFTVMLRSMSKKYPRE